MIRIFFLLFFLSISLNVYSNEKTLKYIEKYSEIAVNEMNKYNIPASITLAQGILESGNGLSKLALEGKNHFGIKCHSSWEGNRIYHDDDEKIECFRKYKSVKQSFEDHSLFLVNSKRYSSLFMLEISDYKGWAKGLKKAGYATNPKYADLLINIIEKYNLTTFDKNRSDLFAKNTYFANSYGLPYLIGVGIYNFDKNNLIYSEVNTSFAFSEASLSANYQFFSNFYSGCKIGIIYTPTCLNKITPYFGGEMIYKKKNILYRIGVDVPTTDNFNFNLAPILRITYLID